MISPIKYPNFKDEATKKYRLRGVVGLGIFAIILFLPIAMTWKAIVINVLFWTFLLVPLCFDSIVRRKKFVVLFAAGLVLASIAFYENPLFLIVLPVIYATIAAPLIQTAMMEREMM
ncbi:hypothetical protein HY488_01835, partial [Candidatus Woesearchaeota archaeon]|nr:hypothetical protein [Candidatus Woesearchaeota archaeon]